MRARLVEDINFERDQNPKKAMGLGGFDAQKAYEETYERGYKGWTDFLDTFMGKKVSFVVTHDYDNTHNSKVNGKRITINVDDYSIHAQHPDTIWFMDESTDMEGRYMIDTSEKIFLEE